MGPGKRDRERPYLSSPTSGWAPTPTESLWYRGILGRGFFETDQGLEEFAFIPDDLVHLFPPIEPVNYGLFGRPASPVEKTHVMPTSDFLVDHACTLLAARRMGLTDLDLEQFWKGYPNLYVLHRWLQAAGILDGMGVPLTDQTREFLEGSRGAALAWLARTWLHSREFNDLHLMPGLKLEGNWQNDPLRTRQSILSFLPGIIEGRLTSRPGDGTFWSIQSLITDVRNAEPDFQRPSGDYDSWYIRDVLSGEFLNGFENWDRVEGALIRYTITGPLYWCGILDLASPAENAEPTAFRFSNWALDLLEGNPPSGIPEEEGKIIARSGGKIIVPRSVPRGIRYNVARFCQWIEEKNEGYTYLVTPSSLDHARKNGLRVGHLLSLLRRSADSVPPSLAQALERWDEHGVEVRMEKMVVLRLGSPEVLQVLRKSRAARFLGDPLGPTAISVQANAWEKVISILAEMGYLCAVDEDLYE